MEILISFSKREREREKTHKIRNLPLLLEEKDDAGATSFSFNIVHQLKLENFEKREWTAFSPLTPMAFPSLDNPRKDIAMLFYIILLIRNLRSI